MSATRNSSSAACLSRGEIPHTLPVSRGRPLKTGEMNSGQVAKRIGGQIPVRYLDAGVKRALCGDDLGREDAAH